MAILPTSKSCCSDDVCTSPAQIPGPSGNDGANGSNGANGANSFTDTTAAFLQPAADANVTVSVGSSSGFTVGQNIFIEQGGYYQIISKATGTLTVKNLGYDDNAPAGTTIASPAHVTPAGIKGADGSTSGGDMLGSNNLSDVASASTSRTHLGLGTAAVVNAGMTDNLIPTNDGDLTAGEIVAATVDGLQTQDATTARGIIGAAKSGAVTGSNITVSATDKVLGRQSAGTGAIEEIPFTSAARTLAAASSTVAQRAALGNILPRYGLLASKTGVDLNSAGSDNALTVEGGRYIIDRVTVENASVSLSAATSGLFTAASGGGTTICADQVLSALTASSKYLNLVLDSGVSSNVFTSGTLYFRCGTPQSVAATASVWVWGWRID